MLEKPELPDEKICACLWVEYGFSVKQFNFLPLGADQHTAVYRAESAAGNQFFIKLRSGNFNETSVRLPAFLHTQGLEQVLPPQPTNSGLLWANLDPYKLILYPFVEGKDGYSVKLSERQWEEFGRGVKQLHAIELPSELEQNISREDFSAHYRQMVREYLDYFMTAVMHDTVTAQLSELMQLEGELILDLVNRTEKLHLRLQAQPPEFVLCHSDLHAGNILVDTEGKLYIVDWDDPIYAPKERDLMFAGGGQGFLGYSALEEELHFYRGYGSVSIDPNAQAYYRYERILVDIALFCEQILMSDGGDKDRVQALRYLKSNFLPGNTIAVARKSDRAG